MAVNAVRTKTAIPMIHKLLAGYLTLALVIGQSLCCCSSLDAAPAPVRSASSRVTSEQAERRSEDACCCKGQADTPECDPASDSRAPDHGHKCPCRDYLGKAGPAAPITAVVVAISAAFDLPDALPYSVAALQPDAIDASRLSGCALDSIYASGTEILRAFHILRC